jgi:ABC-2 type transport system ATP-binding protein
MESSKGIEPLKISNLYKKYENNPWAVEDVSFSIQEGEVFGLLGPNGAGKTSIISIITTLEKATKGRVEIFGFDVEKESSTTKRKVGLVHQEVINSGFFDVEEILKFQSGYYGLSKNKERIDYLLHRLALHEHRHKKVKQLSGGMKRRLMIAKALVHQPKLLLLDEPTAGVDISLREDLWKFVREIKQEGVSVLLTTHYLEEAESLCDRVGIIHRGQIQCVEPTQAIIKKFTQKKVQIEFNQNKSIQSEYLVSSDKNNFNFQIPSEMNLGDFMARLGVSLQEIKDLQVAQGTLEEAFVTVLKGKK